MNEIVLIGPGAIGGSVGGALIENGHAFRIAARTPFERLEVDHPDGHVESAAHCVASPDDLSRADVVFVGVKAQQTLGTRDWLSACVGDGTIVCILQNGVEHLERFEPLVTARARLIPAVVALPARKLTPGKIRVAAKGSLTVPTGTEASVLQELADCSFLRVTAHEDWTTAAWSRLSFNAAVSGVATLLQADNRIFRDDGAYALALALMLEIARVARAEGADLSDEACREILDRVVAKAGPHLSSIVQDRLAERETEWDARNAVIGRIAARHGIDVPLNQMLTTLLRMGEPEPSSEEHASG